MTREVQSIWNGMGSVKYPGWYIREVQSVRDGTGKAMWFGRFCYELDEAFVH